MSLLQIEYYTLKMSGVPSAVFLFLAQLEINVFCNIMLFFCMGSTELTEVASKVWINFKGQFLDFWYLQWQGKWFRTWN